MRISRRSQSNKLIYYFRNLAIALAPRFLFERQRERWLELVDQYDRDGLLDRLNYCNKLDEFEIPEEFPSIAEFRYTGSFTAYYFDLNRYLKCYPTHLKFSHLFGDIIEVPDCPSFVKSRPISGSNQNSVLMKLNKNRHFVFANDKIPFEEKDDRAVWRGAAYREKRKRFLEQTFDSELCDIGQTNKSAEHPHWQKEFMSQEDQLKYKFIISVEGNDVATNLKWIMSSNSLCLMTLPEYETWFMEGRLIPDYHYVQLQQDYSDLDEKICYYTRHTDEALEIIRNAQAYVQQFLNTRQEHLLSLLVLEKYFHKSHQLESPVFSR